MLPKIFIIFNHTNLLLAQVPVLPLLLLCLFDAFFFFECSMERLLLDRRFGGNPGSKDALLFDRRTRSSESGGESADKR